MRFGGAQIEGHQAISLPSQHLREQLMNHETKQFQLSYMVIMNLNLPIRTASRRNDESRNHYITGNSPRSSTEAIAGPLRELAPISERLIVGLDFGTTYSG